MAKFEEYFIGAREDGLAVSAQDWGEKAFLLRTIALAMSVHAPLLEQHLGEKTKVGPALRAAFEKTATSMTQKSALLSEAGSALDGVSQTMSTGRGVLEGMADLQEPPPYTPPTYSPGIQPTEAQIKADGDARAASNQQHAQFSDQFQAQEAQAAAWTKKLDEAYVHAIPPMQAIHGQPDPTEPPPPPPPPNGPPGSSFPPARAPFQPTDDHTGHTGTDHNVRPDPVWEPPIFIEPVDDTGFVLVHPPIKDPVTEIPTPHPPPTTQPHPPTYVPTNTGEVTTVGGQTQSGIDGLSSSTTGASQGSVSTSSAGPSAAALGGVAAGGALGGAVRGASLRGTSPTGAASQVRPVGSSSRGGSAGTLGRSTTAGGTRGAPAGAGGAASRGGAGGRGGAGSRGAAGSRGGAAGAAGSGKDKNGERPDSMEFEQDWIDDEDAESGLLH